jgi:2-hydroxy-5-methyl-1-naphthoate 7-hydroxylase
LRPRIESIVGELLDELDAVGGACEVDLRERFAYPIPIRVISELLGLPESLSLRLREAVDGIFNTSLSAEEAAENYRKTYEVLNELIELRRRDPGDDMTSVLISTRDDSDGGLTESELRDTLLLVISAGHETTVNLLDNASTALLRNPGQLALVRQGRASWSDVIEESLRLDAPVAHLPLRYAVEDIDVDGVTIVKGDAILASYAAAGQDPAHYGPTANQFDVTRANKEHLAFGHGVHFCLAAPLGRLEAEVALPALFDRFPGITLAVPPEELQPMVGFISNGHRSVPVVLNSDRSPRPEGLV